MTVGDLFDRMTSMELTMWQAYLAASAERDDERRKEATFERSITGSEE